MGVLIPTNIDWAHKADIHTVLFKGFLCHFPNHTVHTPQTHTQMYVNSLNGRSFVATVSVLLWTKHSSLRNTIHADSPWELDRMTQTHPVVVRFIYWLQFSHHWPHPLKQKYCIFCISYTLPLFPEKNTYLIPCDFRDFPFRQLWVFNVVQSASDYLPEVLSLEK